MDCLVSAKSHTRTRSSVVQLSLRRDFVVTQAVVAGLGVVPEHDFLLAIDAADGVGVRQHHRGRWAPPRTAGLSRRLG